MKPQELEDRLKAASAAMVDKCNATVLPPSCGTLFATGMRAFHAEPEPQQGAPPPPGHAWHNPESLTVHDLAKLPSADGLGGRFLTKEEFELLRPSSHQGMPVWWCSSLRIWEEASAATLHDEWSYAVPFTTPRYTEPPKPAPKEIDHVRVARAMKQHGGHFVQALGEAVIRADLTNLGLIKKAWPLIWSNYATVAQIEKDKEETAQ